MSQRSALYRAVSRPHTPAVQGFPSGWTEPAYPVVGPGVAAHRGAGAGEEANERSAEKAAAARFSLIGNAVTVQARANPTHRACRALLPPCVCVHGAALPFARALRWRCDMHTSQDLPREAGMTTVCRVGAVQVASLTSCHHAFAPTHSSVCFCVTFDRVCDLLCLPAFRCARPRIVLVSRLRAPVNRGNVCRWRSG